MRKYEEIKYKYFCLCTSELRLLGHIDICCEEQTKYITNYFLPK